MVTGLAFVATAVASLFAEATFVRWAVRRPHPPHLGAWTVALAMFAGASAALAVGVSTGWDTGTFRVFYLLGAITNVPWLALGSVYLLLGRGWGDRSRAWLLVFTGIAIGAVLSAPMEPVSGTAIPVGSDVFRALPRALAAIGSGLGAVVIFAGALWSGVRYARDRSVPRHARLALANALIALGTVVLSSGGIVQGVIGHDEAFTLSLAVGIVVIYGGFLVADQPTRSSRRTSLPATERGSSSTISMREGHL